MFGPKSGVPTKKAPKQPTSLTKSNSLSKPKDTKTKENPAPPPSIPESTTAPKSQDSNVKSVLKPASSVPEDQMSFSFNVSESEKSLNTKIDTQKKTISKLKVELQAIKDENSKLKLDLEKKEALLKASREKFTDDNEGFREKRNYLLKAKILQQEKHIIILESQVRGIKNLETEIYSQLDNTIRVLEKFRGGESGGFAALRESGKIEDAIEFLKVCQVRLSDCGSKGRYEYGLKVHKDGFSTLEREEKEEEGSEVVEKSGIRSRLEFEDSLVEILDMLESLKEQLTGDKNSNTLVNLGQLTRKVTEFMISEGFDVRKVKKVFGKRDQNGFIQKNLAYFDHLSKHLRENADIIAKFNQATESMAQETVAKRGIKTVPGYIEEYMRALSEDKRDRLMKNKDVAGLVESLREISKIEKYMHESQRAILSLFSAKAFGEIESLRDFVKERIKQVLAVVESDLYGPFKAMYTIYKNYENMGNEFTVGVNILSVFGMAGEGIMQALEKLLGLGREFKKENDPADISLRMVISVFEKRVMKSLEELES